MAVYVLASSFNCNEQDENGVRYPIKMQDNLVDVIKKYVKKFGTAAAVCSDPGAHDINDMYAEIMIQSFAFSDIEFEKFDVIDSRNTDLGNPDLIILAGEITGEGQVKFFDKIGLREKMHNADLVMGASLGAMNQCETAYMFPENIDDPKGYFYSGLGIHNEIIVPHFHDYPEDVMKRVIKEAGDRELVAFNDDSFIIVDDDIVKYVGDFWSIKNGKVCKRF